MSRHRHVLMAAFVLFGGVAAARAQGHGPDHPPEKPKAAGAAVEAPAADGHGAAAAPDALPAPAKPVKPGASTPTAARPATPLGSLAPERGTSPSGQPTVVVRLPKAARRPARSNANTATAHPAVIAPRPRVRPYRLRWRAQLDWSATQEPLAWTEPEGR